MTARSALAMVVLAAACGGPTASAPVPSAAPASARAIAQQLVVSAADSTVVLDARTGAVRRTLPAGVLSPTLDAVVSVGPEGGPCADPRTAGPCTVVRAYGLDGDPLEEWHLDGRFALPSTYGPAAGGFSRNGQWLVLVSRDAAASRFAILDLTRLAARASPAGPGAAGPVERGAHTVVALSPRFSFDLIHDDGTALYLIEHPVAGSTTYNVRLYDARLGRLRPEPIFDKAALTAFDPAVGLMDGAFHASLLPLGGEWSYGLYVKRDGTPFVHALNAGDRYATCIVGLPATRTGASMLALSLSHDTTRLFVTDTGAGSVTEISTSSLKPIRSRPFAGRGGAGDPARAAAVASPDGSRIYATAASGIAVLATADLALRGWIATDLAPRALALSADGARLFALAAGGLHVLEAPSGRPLAAWSLPARPSAIALVPAR